MNRFFRWLANLIKSKHVLLVILGFSLLIPSVIGALQLKMESGTSTFVSTDSQAYKDYERFTQSFSDAVVVILLTGDNLSQLVQSDDMAAIEAVETQMAADPGVVSAIGPAFLIKQVVAQMTGTPELPTDPQTILGILTDPQDGTVRTEFRSVFPDTSHALIAITIDASLSKSDQADIVKEIEGSTVPVIVYVSPPGSRAASAGTFITLAANIAAMAPNTTIGAAHPVDATGGGLKAAELGHHHAHEDQVRVVCGRHRDGLAAVEGTVGRVTSAWRHSVTMRRMSGSSSAMSTECATIADL